MPFPNDVSHPETPVRGTPSRVQVAEVTAVNADDGTIDARPLNGRATKVHIGYPTWWVPNVGERCLVADRDGDPRQPICLGYLAPADGSNTGPTIQGTVIGAAVSDASTTVKGVTKLSVAPASPTSPIAVGDNDSRMTNARTPTAHASTHASGGSDPVTLAESQVTNLVTDLAAKAPLASPVFTGDPQAPTPAAGDNDTSIATTAFVTAAIAAAGGSGSVADASTTVKGITKLSVAPVTSTSPIAVGDNDGRVPTQNENDALQGTGLANGGSAPTNTNRFVTDDDSRMTNSRVPTTHASTHASGGSDPITIAESQVTSLSTDLAAKAPLASPVFTGDPKAPTPSLYDNDTSIATTAFVQSTVGDSGSALPTTNLYDGRIFSLLVDTTNGVVWHFRYRSGSASTYKWEFIGGPAMMAEPTTDESRTVVAFTYADTATADSPAITVPHTGDYIVTFSVNAYAPTGSAAGAAAAALLSVGGTQDTSTILTLGEGAAAATGQQFQSTMSSVHLVTVSTNTTAGKKIKMQYNSTTVAWNFRYRKLHIVPVRCVG